MLLKFDFWSQVWKSALIYSWEGKINEDIACIGTEFRKKLPRLDAGRMKKGQQKEGSDTTVVKSQGPVTVRTKRQRPDSYGRGTRTSSDTETCGIVGEKEERRH